MGGVSELLDSIKEQVPGEDFQVLTISFNAEENAEMAKRKKENYYRSFHKEMSPKAWRFLTAPQESIDAITAAVGFEYEPAGNEWVHPAAIMVLAPDGMVSRYLYGVTFLPFDVKMALMEASQGRTGPTINKVLLYCFSYDPEGKTYVFNILKVTGSVTLVFVGLFVIFLVVSTRRHRRREDETRKSADQ
jgi:protein SCO1